MDHFVNDQFHQFNSGTFFKIIFLDLKISQKNPHTQMVTPGALYPLFGMSTNLSFFYHFSIIFYILILKFPISYLVYHFKKLK